MTTFASKLKQNLLPITHRNDSKHRKNTQANIYTIIGGRRGLMDRAPSLQPGGLHFESRLIINF